MSAGRETIVAMKHSHPLGLCFKFIILFLVFAASDVALWAQEMNAKFAWTTQLFLNELKEQPERPKVGSRRSTKYKMPDDLRVRKPQRLFASPDTIGSVAYISCFIHLKEVRDLSAVRSLGVKVDGTFDGLDFITARVPIEKLEALAGVDNVTSIKVAECMQPMTDAARQITNVDDLLNLSADATAVGVNTKYDGTGVVLGIIDTGIDFQHIAFKDKNGKSRIKRAYVYDGTESREYTTITNTSPTTDDATDDHGTHTASTAGGSSVIVSGSTVTVTDNHANATYGGMAPGTDLYLAGCKELYKTDLSNALINMVKYASEQDKPLVVSNSWGNRWRPRDGTDEWTEIVDMIVTTPGRIILFSAGNQAGHSKDNEGGGFFVKKNSASSSSPLGTILRSNYYSKTDGGYNYSGYISSSWSTKELNCKIYVLNSSTGAILKTWTVSSSNPTFSGLDTYYDGTLNMYRGYDEASEKFFLSVYTGKEGLKTKRYTTTVKDGEDYFKSSYTLAIEVYPASGSAKVEMWGASEYSYFTNHLTTSGLTWTAGTDDMSVNNEVTIPGVISVGAYVSKEKWKNYENEYYHYSSTNPLGDIASFSSYATAEQSPTGEAYPWITAPGAQVVAGVNHYHTSSVDDGSYYHDDNKSRLVVNNDNNPYGVMQGTSMSTPVAAGIVAQWLQAAQEVGVELTVNDVKDIMAQTAIKDSYTNGTNASHFGKGKIDALAGIEYILNKFGRKLTLKATPVSGMVAYGQEMTLTANRPEAKIYYTTDGSEPTPSSYRYSGSQSIGRNMTLKAKAYLDGYEPSETLTRTYQVKLDIKADKPSGDVPSGESVTLSCSHPKAVIYYTTDGTTPTKTSKVYRSPITIGGNMTLKAIAMHDDCLSSDVLTRTYTILVTSVSASPVTAARLIAGTEVTLTASPSDSRIYYTTDGSEPTQSSRLYTSPIILERTVVLKAKAFRDGYRPGETFTWNYNVAPEPKVITLTPAKLELFWGRTAKLTYAFTPADAETMSLVWESSDPEVVIVNQEGVVRALRPGHATITLTARNGVVGKCELTVPDPLYQLFVWSKSGLKTGYLSTDEPHFNIVGDIVRFSTKRLSMDIHRDTLDKFTLEQVLAEHPKRITLSEKKSVALGATVQLKAVLTPADAETSLTWVNDNPEVVNVTQDGHVTALQVGEANLMVQTSNGLRAGIHITVPEPCLRFYVWMRNGEVHGYDLEEKPEVKLGEEVFMLTSSRQTVQYQAADILRFTLQDAVIEEEIADGIAAPLVTDNLELREGTFLIAGSRPYSFVQVYDTAGRLVQTAQVDGEGNLSLSLTSLSEGIYIIRTEQTTLKIQKR